MITSHDRPRLREDLVAEAIEDQGIRFIDVIDPDNGSTYRFYDVEYSLACAMDGERDVAGLVRWAEEELGIVPSSNELQTVIATLGDLGYLDATARQQAQSPTSVPTERVSSAPALPAEIEIGLFHSAPTALPFGRAPDLELGAAGPSISESRAPVAEIPLGPSGVPGPALPVPPVPPISPARNEPAQVMAARAGTDTARSADPRPPITAHPRAESQATAARGVEVAKPRPSEPQVRSVARVESPPQRQDPPMRAPEPALRAPEPAVRSSAPRMRPSDPLRPPRAGSVPDPSIDLSLPIRPDDVKEAVRASREMRSVDLPTDLLQALESAELNPHANRPEKSARSSSPALPPVAAMLPLSGAPLSISEPFSPPAVPPLVPVPRAPARIEYPRAAEVRPALAPTPREITAPVTATPVAMPSRRRSNGWIVAILVIAILGVVGFGVWKFVIDKPTTAPVAPVPISQPEPAAVVVPPAAVEPAPVTARLSLVKPPAVSVQTPVAGVLQSVVSEGAVVKESELVARLMGARVLEQQIAEIRGDLDKRYPADVARIKAAIAEAGGNKALIARLQVDLTNRNNRIKQRSEELQGMAAELAKLSVLATVSGTATTVAKAGARLGANAMILKLVPAAHLSGSVELAGATIPKPGDPIEVTAKGEVATTATCIAETVQNSTISFRCPVGGALTDGVEVVVSAK
jgi:hypothetical protein